MCAWMVAARPSQLTKQSQVSIQLCRHALEPRLCLASPSPPPGSVPGARRERVQRRPHRRGRAAAALGGGPGVVWAGAARPFGAGREAYRIPKRQPLACAALNPGRLLAARGLPKSPDLPSTFTRRVPATLSHVRQRTATLTLAGPGAAALLADGGRRQEGWGAGRAGRAGEPYVRGCSGARVARSGAALR